MGADHITDSAEREKTKHEREVEVLVSACETRDARIKALEARVFSPWRLSLLVIVCLLLGTVAAFTGQWFSANYGNVPADGDKLHRAGAFWRGTDGTSKTDLFYRTTHERNIPILPDDEAQEVEEGVFVFYLPKIPPLEVLEAPTAATEVGNTQVMVNSPFGIQSTGQETHIEFFDVGPNLIRRSTRIERVRR